MSDLIKSLRSCAEYEAPEFQRLPCEHIAWRAADEIDYWQERALKAEQRLAAAEEKRLFGISCVMRS